MGNSTKNLKQKLLNSNRQLLKNFGLKMLLVLVTFVFILNANAQQFYTGNVNSPSNSFPFASTGGKSLQTLIAPGELTGSYFGNIIKVYFQGTASASGTYAGLLIKMGQTTATTLPTGAFYSGTLTTVYTATSTVLTTGTNGWASVNLQTPFLYDPTKSLVIEIQVCSATGGFSVTNVSKSGFRRTWNSAGCNTTYSGQDANLMNTGVDMVSAGANDVGVISIDSPYTYCSAGILPVKATIKNFGTNQVTGLNVNWSVNGTLQTPLIYSTLLDTLNGSNPNSAQVTLGSYTFPTSSVNIKAWTSNPNSVADTVRANDTAFATKGISMSGIYTINPSGSGSSNFTTFAAAIAGLSNGVCGPVVFNVSPATYTITAALNIPTIIGASPINTITFEGTSAATRIVTGSIATSALVFVQGNYVTIRNITFTNTYTSNCSGIAIVGTANKVNINNCVVNLPNVASATSCGIYTAGAASGYTAGASAVDSLSIDSNTITGSYYGLYLYGSSTTAGAFGFNRDFKIRKNTLNNIYYYGVYLYGIQNGIDFMNNNINMATTGYYGLYAYYLYNHNAGNAQHRFIGNTIKGTFAYNYLYYASSTVNNPTLIYNNMIGGTTQATTNYGLYVYNTTYTGYFNIYNNTFNLNNGTGTVYGLYYYNGTGGNALIKNNIFSITSTAATSGYPLYCSSNPTTGSVNYNVYYNASNTNLVYRNSITYTPSNFMTNIAGGDTSWNTNPGFISNTTNLHLPDACTGRAGASYLLSDVPNDVDGNTRIVPLAGAHEASSQPNDMSVVAILSPVPPVAATTYPVTIRVKNTGSNTVSSFDFNYKLNSGAVVTESYSGAGIAACDTLTYTFFAPVTLIASNTLKVFTSAPNFTTDVNRANDTITATINAALAGGNYTINPSGSGASNFTSFALANTALSNGIAGPVNFTVAAGTYTSRIIINGPIAGASNINTITFDGVSASTRILASSQTTQSVVQFIGCKYVTFKNFTINNTYTSSCTGVGINSSNITLKNNIINMTSGSTTTTSYGINITNDASGYGSTSCAYDSISVDSNVINGGYYGIQLYANTSGTPSNYFIKYRWNTISGSYYSGIYHYYGNSGTEIIGNQISMSTANTSTQYGIYFYGYNSSSTNPPTPNRFIGNTLNNTAYMGMYIYYPYGSIADPSQIYNNMILGGFRYSTAAYGLYLYNTAYTNVYHNTVNMDHPTTTSTTYSAFYSSGTATVNVKNNIFMVTGGGGTANCAYFGTAPSGNVVNYNVYYNNANTNIIYRGAQYTNSTYKTTTAGGDSSSYGLLPFVNFATRNFHLTNGCTGKGVDLTSKVSNDFEGDVRSTTPNIGADEFVGGASNDLALDALLTPVFPIVAGSNTVSARIRNVGGNTVSSFDLSYSINGGTPVSTSWFGTLNACDTTSVILSTPFTVVSGTIYNLKVYTSNPNFSTDPNRGNDTSITQVVTPMHGVYTIGATASDFTTFNNAAAALQSRGVDGAVIFNVKTGTYVESVNMTNASGVSAVNNITFQSAANNRDSVIIAPATSAAYIWQFTNASYITLNKITLRSTSTVSAQNGINIVGGSSFDTITDSKIDMAVQTSYTNYAVYGTALTSTCNGMTFKNNIINGSYYGIYVYGTTNTLASRFWNFTFDNNTLANTYAYGFYSYYSQGINFTNNNVTTSSLYSGQIYYFMYADSFTFSGNKFNLLNNATMYLGYYSINGNGITGRRGRVANNSFVGGGTGGTTIYMGYQSTNLDYVNNTFNIFSTSQAAYVYNSGSIGLVFKNNIFSNRTTGSAAYYSAIPTATTALMDYNNYYSTGGSLTSGASVQTTIPAWRTICNCEKNGLNYRPAVTSVTDNTPNPADTAVWVLNGRGEFLPYLTKDINGNARPATIVDGAPDLGAYNVNPGTTTLAPRATASPVTPTAGTTQVFTLGNDTVASIVWDAFTTPPATIAVRQYSGAKPKLIGSAVPNYPYFYTDIQAPAGTYLYDVKVNYRDNWMGTLYTTFGFTEDYMRLANKETSLAWNTNSGSTVDTVLNVLTGTSFTNATNLFTGSDIFNPLPVKLTTFTGSLLNADAKLTWSTASEINSSNFVVERSIDGKYFEAITNVKAAGNSSSLKSYNHLDKGIITLLNSAGTIYYRLKMVDLDGSFGYSKTIEIKTIENTKEKVTVTPNPFTTDLTINVETVNNANGTVEISDINGRVIVSQNIEVVKGSSTITVNSVEKLKQGIYFVRYSTETGTQVFKMLKN